MCVKIQVSIYTIRIPIYYIEYNTNLLIDGSFEYINIHMPLLRNTSYICMNLYEMYEYEMSHFKTSWLVDNDSCKAEKLN